MNSGNRVEVSANDERPAWEGRPECVEHRGGLPLASERARKDRAAKKRTASVEVEREDGKPYWTEFNSSSNGDATLTNSPST